MDRDVKPPRPDEGAARQARTRRTRAAVVEAARSLFVERGYAATTIEAISDRSDTPQATVYRLFSSKLGILKEVLDVSIGGDDAEVAMADRPTVRALLYDDDPKHRLAGFAGAPSRRDGPRRSRSSHPRRRGQVRRRCGFAARRDRSTTSRRPAPHRTLTCSIGCASARARERDAADIVHALASPEVYGLLVFDRAWTGERYEKWLRSILIDQLLPE